MLKDFELKNNEMLKNLKPMYQFQYSRKPHKVMRAARKTLYLSQETIAKYLGITQSQVSVFEKDCSTMGVSTWFRYCQLTHINCDDSRYGYSRHLHLNAIHSAIKEGLFVFPVSNSLLQAIKRNERNQNRAFEVMSNSMFFGMKRNSQKINTTQTECVGYSETLELQDP